MPTLSESQLYDLGNRHNGCFSEAKWSRFVNQYMKDLARFDKKIKRLQVKIRKLERKLEDHAHPSNHP